MINKKRKILTLCIIHNHPRVLLGMKKRGFGKGRWNGFGGKVEKGEEIIEATLRETKEEAGIRPHDIERVGILDFAFEGNEEEILEVHIFKGSTFDGEPTESEEMKPQWFYIDEIPFSEMWTDDCYWFPLFLKNKKFKGHFLFGEGDRVLEYELKEVSTL